MKEMRKCYHAFISAGWRMAMTGVFVLLLLLEITTGIFLRGKGIFIPIDVLFVNIWVLAELVADYWTFSGNCKKESHTLDYLRSGSCGRSLLKKAAVMDTIRRMGMLFAFYLAVRGMDLLSYLWGDSMYDSQMVLVGHANLLLDILLVSAALNFTRYFQSRNAVCVTVSIVVLLEMYFLVGGFVWILFAGKVPGICRLPLYGIGILLLFCLAAGAAVLAIWQICHRMEGGYHDGEKK